VNGEWNCYYLDDYFPCIKNGENKFQTVFSRANGPELWVLLLEKAYAKAFKCYENIESGLTGQAIRDLTGSPYEFLKNEDVKRTWEFLVSNQ
jgi:calpain-15